MLKFGCIICFLLVIISCKKNFKPKECTTTISYSEDIVPIINSSCISGLGPGIACHDSWAMTHSGVENAINIGTWQETIYDTQTMPPIPNSFDIDLLSKDELQSMWCWIEQGYPDN